MSDKVDDALQIFFYVRYELQCLLIKVVQELSVKHHAVKTQHDCDIAISEILSSVGDSTLKEITSFRLSLNKEKLFQQSSWKPLASIDIDTFDSSLIFDILLRFKTFLDLKGNYGWCNSPCAPCCPNCDHSDTGCIKCRNNKGLPSNKCNHMCKHCKFPEMNKCSKECCNKCKISYVTNQRQYDMLVENKVKRPVVNVSHIKVCQLFAFMQGLNIASKFRNMDCHNNKTVLKNFLDSVKQSKLGEIADISDMKELEILLSIAFQNICKFVNIPDTPFLKNLHDIFEYKEKFEEYFRKNKEKVQKMLETENFLKLGSDLIEEQKETKEYIVLHIDKKFAEWSESLSSNNSTSSSMDVESLQEYKFELEKKYEGGCLLSFCDVNIDVSTNQIEFKLCRLDEDDKNKSPVYRTLVENKDFKIEDDRGIFYAHIENCLKSGYKYSFLMKGRTSDGIDVIIVYKDLEAIDECDCCNYIDIKEEIIFLAHNNGVSNNIHMFDISKPIADNTRCKAIRKGPKAAETVGKFRELTEEYFSDNSYLQRFPPGYYVRDDDLRSFGDLLESFLVAPPKHFLRILTGYNPVYHLKVFGYNKKQLEEIGIGEDEEHKFSNSVTVVNSKERLVFVGVVSSKPENLKETMEQCNVMLKAIYMLNQCYLRGTYVAVIGAVVLPNVNRNQLTKYNFKFLNVDDAIDLEKEGILFITKEDLQSEQNLKTWWTSALQQIYQKRRTHAGKEQHDLTRVLKEIAGQMMGVMALVDVQLPKVTKNIADKICTLLLNIEQIKAIQDQSNKKVLLGPFGSGKSLVLKEIARMLFEREESGIVYYICFDPYSLLEIEVEDYFKKLQRETKSNIELKSVSVKDVANKVGFQLDELYDLCGVPTQNIGDLLVRLVQSSLNRSDPSNVHFLIDEFTCDSIDEAYCNYFGSYLKNQLKDSKVAIAIQSVKKFRKIYNDGVEHEIKSCSLQKSGMKAIVLSRCMRMAANLYQLIEVAQECIESKTTSLVLEVKRAKEKRKEPHLQMLKSTQSASQTSKKGEKHITHNDFKTVEKENVFVSKGRSSVNLNEIKSDYVGTTVEKMDVATKSESDFSKFHEPEMMPMQFRNLLPTTEGEEVLKRLTSTVQYQKGKSGNTVQSHQPQLIFLNDSFSVTQVLSGKLLAIVIEHLCLSNQHRTTIICNLLEEAVLTKFALSFIQELSCTRYTPYLLDKFPSKEEKRKVLNEMRSFGGVLLTDYRGFRGCETDHCICFVSPNEKYANHVLVEMLSRAVAKIDVLVLPAKENENDQGSLGQVIQAWEDAQLVQKSRVKLTPNGESWMVSLNEGEKIEIEVLPEDKQYWFEVKKSFQVTKNRDAVERYGTPFDKKNYVDLPNMS